MKEIFDNWENYQDYFKDYDDKVKEK
jgi:hypothetical protein